MKIAISGSSSVGKTTLLSALRNKGLTQGYFVVDEIVRSLMKKGVRINKVSNHESQCKILETHYINILKHDNLITDRCVLDAFAYATWSYLNNKFTYQEHQEHKKIFLDCVFNYDKIFYLPIEFPATPDGVRDIDESYREEVHNLFMRIIDLYKLPVVYLTGSVEERANAFESNL
jgi:predicted ATPase